MNSNVKSLCARLCLTALSFFLLSACKDNSSALVQEKIVPIKGDPLAFIDGAKTNSTSGLPISLFSGEGKWIVRAIEFRTQKQLEFDENQSLEQGNEATTQDKTEATKKGVIYYQMDSLDKPKSESVYFSSISGNSPRLFFDKRDDHLFLTMAIASNGLGTPPEEFTVHHYSVKEGDDAFSVLFSLLDSNKGKHLVAMSFLRVQDKPLLSQMVDSAYNYIFGPGVVVRWRQDKELNMLVCTQTGAMTHYSKLAHEAIGAWDYSLGFGERLAVNTVDSNACPPFSDLNTQTVFHVPDWVEVLGDIKMSAFVYNIPNYYESTFVDSDIFFLEGEWNEDYLKYKQTTIDDPLVYESYLMQSDYKRTMKHEFGHILGLDHTFDDNVRSVMSYDGLSYIQNHDTASIQALYPKK